jgi:hypothetical protein
MQTAAFSKLSATLEHFNDALSNDVLSNDKLDNNAMQTIQLYLKDPEVTTLDKDDERKMQHPLNQLELLRDQITLDRVSPTVMKQINRQLINLAELIEKEPSEAKKDAHFIIVKLEVCFLKILSDEGLNCSKQRQKSYEERMANNKRIEPSRVTPHSGALYMDRQQRIINELVKAALFDVIQYFKNKNQVFIEHFTQEFLESLSTMVEKPNVETPDKMSVDVLKILTETAVTCRLPITVLISNLKYAIIGFSERTNEYSILLQAYIRNTECPTLKEFNKTIDLASALSLEEVDKFDSLFELYHRTVLFHQRDMSQRAV